MLYALWRDLRLSLRSLLRQPGFLTVVVLTLGIGIGAVTTIFTVFKGVLLDPLPYSDPAQLVRLYQHEPEEPGELKYVAGPAFEAYRDETSSYEEVAASYTYRELGADLAAGGSVERVSVLPVTAGYFEVLGARPVRGRTFDRRDETGAPLAVLSHEMWRDRLQSRGDVAGEVIRLDDVPHTIIGVMPPRLEDPVVGRVDVWVPWDTRPGRGWDNPQNHQMTVLARLAPGVRLEQAQEEMARLDARLDERWPEAAGERTRVVSLHRDLVRGADRLLAMLLAAVGLLLLVVCVNVANLFLIRSTGRARELSIRAALGSGRGRLVRHLVVESLLLAGLGGLLGVGLAIFGVDLLSAVARDSIPRLGDVTLDATVLGVAAGVAILTALVFGVLPALRLSATRPDGLLRGAGRSVSASRRTGHARDALVVAQVGLALMLLVGAGVLVASFQRLSQVDLGVRTAGVLTFEVNLPAARYDAAARARFHETLAERLAAVPEIRAAGAVSRLPATGTYHSWATRPLTGPLAGVEGDLIQGEQRVVSGDYFDALGIRLLEGRTFREGAAPGELAVREVVVSRRVADVAFPGVGAVGQRLQVAGAEVEVVGVVADVALTPEGAVGPLIYHDHAQFAANRNWSLTQVVATTAPDPSRLLPAVRAALAELDPALVVHAPAELADVVGRGRARTRFAMLLLASFAAIALGLAGLGLYGVLGYSVRQRTRELAIRSALGAGRAALRRMVLRHGLGLVAAGAVLGAAGALAVGRALSSFLFDTSPFDPLAFLAALATLTLVALLAAWLPVRRATAIEPRQALNAE